MSTEKKVRFREGARARESECAKGRARERERETSHIALCCAVLSRVADTFSSVLTFIHLVGQEKSQAQEMIQSTL